MCGENICPTRVLYDCPYHLARSRYRCDRCIAHPAAKYPPGHWFVTPRSVSKLGRLSGASAFVWVLVNPIISWDLSGIWSAPGMLAASASLLAALGWLNPRPRNPMRFEVRSKRSPMYAPLLGFSNRALSAPWTMVCESLRNLNITWLSSRTTVVGVTGEPDRVEDGVLLGVGVRDGGQVGVHQCRE